MRALVSQPTIPTLTGRVSVQSVVQSEPYVCSCLNPVFDSLLPQNQDMTDIQKQMVHTSRSVAWGWRPWHRIQHTGPMQVDCIAHPPALWHPMALAAWYLPVKSCE